MRHSLIAGVIVAGVLGGLGQSAFPQPASSRSASGPDRPLNADEVGKLAAQASGLMAAAAKDTDQEVMDSEIDKAVAIYDKLVDATAGASDYAARMQHFRFALARIMAKGLVKSEPYAQRVLYMLDGPDDRRKILQFTQPAIALMKKLQADAAKAKDSWSQDDESKITGALYELEDLMREARFREAWILFYRAIALPNEPGAAAERRRLLQDALAAVEGTAQSAGDEAGAKFPSLLLSGMAWRELGKRNEAANCLQRVTGGRVPADLRLKALFEAAHASIDDGDAEVGQRAIGDFQAKGGKIEGVTPVAIDMQSALLASHLYEVRAAAIKADDPAGARELLDRGAGVMLDFIKGHPTYTKAFVAAIAPKYEGRDVDKLPPQIVTALGVYQASRNTPKSLDEAERLFKAVLRNKDAASQSALPEALGSLGRINADRGRNLDAACHFRQLAQMLPQDPQAKSAARDAVRCMERVINQPGSDPSDLDYAEYTRDLEVLVKNWSNSDRQVRSYCYPLGLQYERASRNLDAIAAYDKVPPDCEVYLPARFHALSIRANMMLDDPDADQATRSRSGQDLVAQLRGYHGLAAGFQSDDKDRLKLARAMGADVDLLAGQVQLEILNQPADARQTAERALAEWPDVPDIQDRCLTVQVHAYLKEGDLTRAIELVDKIQKGSQAVIGQVVAQIRLRIERLDAAKDAGELNTYLGVYGRFAETVYAAGAAKVSAEAAGKPQGWRESQMYPYRQALAGAYEYSSDRDKTAKALEIYRDLSKQNKEDAVNVRGMARCYRKLGANIEAMNRYNQLVAGLQRHSRPWWKAQLERMDFALEICGNRPEDLKKIQLELRILSDEDAQMGGLRPRFSEIQSKAAAAESAK